MGEGVREFVRGCLYCADYQAGGIVPQPPSDAFHGKDVCDMVHFDFLHMGASEVDEGVDTRDGFAYMLVILDDMSRYVWLRPARACTANFLAGKLVT